MRGQFHRCMTLKIPFGALILVQVFGVQKVVIGESSDVDFANRMVNLLPKSIQVLFVEG